jgi:hypothetical protein
MSELSRRDLIATAAACAVTPLSAARLCAAELKVSLSNERVGQPPSTFQPIVGTWRVVQDGADKIIMVDGQPWKSNQNNRTLLLAERARSFYNASQEDFIDNVKQFAYYPIATLNGVDNFSNGTISLKFKTIAGDLDRCSPGSSSTSNPTGTGFPRATTTPSTTSRSGPSAMASGSWSGAVRGGSPGIWPEINGTS